MAALWKILWKDSAEILDSLQNLLLPSVIEFW
jgi:hypothetical protein